MKTESILIQLEAWLQQEIGCKKELLALLERQEEAIVQAQNDELQETSLAVEAGIGHELSRANRREVLVAGLAQAWGVAAETLGLSSIIERARREGLNPAALTKLRGQLRDVAAAIQKRGRRIASLARFHQGLLAELIEGLIPELPRGRRDDFGGALVDAKA